VRRRPDHLADPGPRKSHSEHNRRSQGDADQQEIVRRDHTAGDEQRHDLEGGRHAHGLEFRSPHHPHNVIKDQNEGVADQKLHQNVGAIDLAHEHALEDQAEKGGPDRAAQNRQRKAAGELIGRQRKVGAEHIEGAVTEIDDFEHAEDQGQPHRDQEQQHADDQTAGGLRHHAGGARETAGERVEIQRKYPQVAGGRAVARSTGTGAALPVPAYLDQVYPLFFFQAASSSRMVFQSPALTSGT
jgi:hypothetical protein